MKKTERNPEILGKVKSQLVALDRTGRYGGNAVMDIAGTKMLITF